MSSSNSRNTITGFHANYEEKCKHFVIDGKLIISKDTTFLGKGMYFWDNQHNSKWWKEKKTRDSVQSAVRIVTARIDIEDILDLTDEDVVDTVNRLWEQYLSKTKKSNSYTNKNKEKLGLALDTLPLINELPVRKANLRYREQENSFYNFEQGSRGCNISTKNRIIYMVKDEKRIFERAYLEE